ncbi:hypothetical protein [Hymenobacter rubidus]|uniref:hypothetical protein n=1 Tax=Hymenobacter rubidus TaxID=1441626 RepID=UPI00191E0A4A|nr:hypothetical protein [Hymenobacter rubidus]
MFLPLVLRAQVYEPGLLVRSTGDTLRGEIENSFWVEPPTFIRFRLGPTGAVETVKPRQLRAVLLTNGRYFRYEALPINHADETELAHLPHGYATHVKVDSLLAEVLVEGPMTLFRVVRPSSLHLLLHRAGQPMVDLCERKYLRHAPGGGWEVTDGNNYRNQLSLYLSDCPEASQAAKSAPFTAAGVVAVVQRYNQACGPDRRAGRSWLAVAAPRRRVSVQGGLLAGVRYNHLENTSVDFTGCTDCEARPFGGLYAEVLLPSRRTAVYGELSLGNFRNQLSRFVTVVTTTPDPRCAGCTREEVSVVASTYRYQALMSTSRIGVRYFFRLPHEQQLLFGLSYEMNSLWHITGNFQPGPAFPIYDDDLGYPVVGLVPALTAGWRWNRVSATADVHSLFFIGGRFVVRGSLAYRLGRSHDQMDSATRQR